MLQNRSTTIDVWTWLPEASDPVFVGFLRNGIHGADFRYDSTYTKRSDAIPLYLPELPFGGTEQAVVEIRTLPGCLRDGAPDAWGRRVLAATSLNRREFDQIDDIDALLESGSDRIGALDFQTPGSVYVARQPGMVAFDDLLRMVAAVDRADHISDEIASGLRYRCAVGGARPKALVGLDGEALIAKYPSAGDRRSVVKAEFVAMRLAAHCGLAVAPARLASADGTDVLLIERFDRVSLDGHWGRRSIVSALTIMGLDEMTARYASYGTFADVIRRQFAAPSATLRELFARLTFNVLVGNTDDHARNHAAFWDGSQLSLTPAYDICPQPRVGQEASQAMLIYGSDRMSRVAGCIYAAPQFQLSNAEAIGVVVGQLRTIGERWHSVCADAGIEPAERSRLWSGSFLNPYAFTGLEGDAIAVRDLADEVSGRCA